MCEDIRSPGTVTIDSCKLPCGCLNLNPGPLEEQWSSPLSHLSSPHFRVSDGSPWACPEAASEVRVQPCGPMLPRLSRPHREAQQLAEKSTFCCFLSVGRDALQRLNPRVMFGWVGLKSPPQCPFRAPQALLEEGVRAGSKSIRFDPWKGTLQKQSCL